MSKLLHLLEMHLVLAVLQHSMASTAVQLLLLLLLLLDTHCCLIIGTRQLIHWRCHSCPLLLLLLLLIRHSNWPWGHRIPRRTRSSLGRRRSVPVAATVTPRTALRQLAIGRLSLRLLLLLLLVCSIVRPWNVDLMLWTLRRVHRLHVLRLYGHVQVVRLLILRLLHRTVGELLQVRGDCGWHHAGRTNCRLHAVLRGNVGTGAGRRLQAELTDVDVALPVVMETVHRVGRRVGSVDAHRGDLLRWGRLLWTQMLLLLLLSVAILALCAGVVRPLVAASHVSAHVTIHIPSVVLLLLHSPLVLLLGQLLVAVSSWGQHCILPITTNTTCPLVTVGQRHLLARVL